MYPVEYAIPGYEARIRRCPELKSLIESNNKPAYWYIAKDLHPEQNESAWKAGLKCWYWTKNGAWATHTPWQFETAEKAHEHFIAHTPAVTRISTQARPSAPQR